MPFFAALQSPLVRYVAMIGGVLLLFFLTYLKGVSHQREVDQIAAMKAENALYQKLAVFHAKETEIVTKYVDRVKVIREKGDTIVKEVPVYVTAKDDAACTIPAGFVSLWNLSSQTGVSESATRTDATLPAPRNTP